MAYVDAAEYQPNRAIDAPCEHLQAVTEVEALIWRSLLTACKLYALCAGASKSPKSRQRVAAGGTQWEGAMSRRILLALFCVLAAVGARAQPSAAPASPPAALAAPEDFSAPEARARQLWRRDMAKKSAPASGCYSATFPSTEWRSAPCSTAPGRPHPARLDQGPQQAGAGNSPVASPARTISSATGLLAKVAGVTSEANSVSGGEQIVAIDEERRHLQVILDALGPHPSDPKLDAVLYFLVDQGWLDLGCIVFSQYYDTTRWVAEKLSQRFTVERPRWAVAVYAGAGKSGILVDGEWKSVERESIKRGVKEKQIKTVVATDAACEGLNLQTLGTLINVDLPWNPSRLEQRLGRIKRFGQRRDRVDMLNLVYQGTIDEQIYEKLSERMRDRFDIFGTLPDVIEDDWIEDIENFDERMREYTRKRERANAFDLRYAADVEARGERWELCERVLARHDVVEQLSRGWSERRRELIRS